MTRRCGGSLWVVEWGGTYDHSLAGARGRPADRTLMVEPDSAEPIWKTRVGIEEEAAWPVSWRSTTVRIDQRVDVGERSTAAR